MLIGDFQALKIERETRHGAYLVDEDGEEVLLPKNQLFPGMQVGQVLRVFVYTDSEDRPVATLKTPLAKVGDFAMLRVMTVSSAGAFLDWGLDKDLFCPIKEQQPPMREDGEYLVRVYLDGISRRVSCSARLYKFLRTRGDELTAGQAVQIIVAEKTPEMIAVIIDKLIKGAIFPDEWHEKLEVGDVRTAFVKSIRSEDGKVSISLRPQGHRAVRREGEKLLEALREAGGSLPVSDKSSPEEIHRLFGLSKSAFKRLIGALYKEGQLIIEGESIRLSRS